MSNYTTHKWWFSILISAVLFVQSVSAQKVALVLSGGGAKGLAHAGALLALEENGIPIDYVTGTSMGALVGAFYAAGYSAKDIVSIARSDDLQNWVKNIPPKKYRYLYEEETADPSWVGVKLRIDSSFSATFRTHLSEDHFLNFSLAQKLASATQISGGDFNKLFVPYRATASEIFTEKAIVLKKGNLFEAARASMAVPFVYRPVKIHNELLFDGGIYNNFPAETAKTEFAPDIIIGINVASKKVNVYPYGKDDHLIAESLLFAILDKTDSTELSPNDIFIDVALKEYTALDFDEAKHIVKLGYKSAMSKMPEIKQKIQRRIRAEELKSRRIAFHDNSLHIQFDSLKIEGFKKNQFKYIKGRFSPKRPLYFDNIEEGYNRIVSNDYFANIFPSYEFGKKNTFSLSGNPNPGLNGKIGGTLISRNTSQLYFGLDVKRLTRVLSHHSIGIHTGRFYQSIHIKSKIQFPGRLNLSIMPEYLFNRWNYISTTDLFSQTNRPQIQDTQDTSYGVNIEVPAFRKMRLTFSSSYFRNKDKFSNKTVLVSTDTLDVLKLKGVKWQAKLHYNTLNFRQYAFSGEKLRFYTTYIRAKDNYKPGNTSNLSTYQHQNPSWVRLGLELEKYFKISDNYRIGLSSHSIFSTQPALATLRATELNQAGFFPLQDSKTLVLENFRGRKFSTVGVKNIFLLSDKAHLRLEGYSLYHYELLQGNPGSAAQYKAEGQLRLSGTAGAVYHSIIGPISFSVNYYDQPEHRWGAILHIGYLLFNRKSLE